jgi:hypothetical protein
VRRLAAIALVALLLVALVVAQLVLPGIAASNIRDRLKGSGDVISVKVSAFPAIELLWHHADSVTVSLGAYRSSPSHLAALLHQASGVDTVTASASELSTGRLTLRNATLHKHGSELTGTAQVSEASIRHALPVLKSVTPVASSNGLLTVRGTGSLFGVTATVDATVSAQNGAVVVAPDVPLGGLATITVFSNPRVAVQSIGASGAGNSFEVSASATLQ